MLENFIFRGVVMSVALALTLGVTSLATAQTAPPAMSDKALIWKQKAIYGSWEVICAKPEKKEVC